MQVERRKTRRITDIVAALDIFLAEHIITFLTFLEKITRLIGDVYMDSPLMTTY